MATEAATKSDIEIPHEQRWFPSILSREFVTQVVSIVFVRDQRCEATVEAIIDEAVTYAICHGLYCFNDRWHRDRARQEPFYSEAVEIVDRLFGA